MDMDGPELTVDKGALGPLEVVGPVGAPSRPTPRSKPRWRWRYRFAPQDYDIGVRSELYDPARRQAHPDEAWKTWKLNATLVEVDAGDSTLDLEWMR